MIRLLSLFTCCLLTAARANADAHSAYLLGCGGCHGEQGVSNSKLVPDLRDQVGYFLSVPDGRGYLVRLPNVAFYTASDAELATILNYMVFTIAGASTPAHTKPFTAAEVGTLRKHPLNEVSLLAFRNQLIDTLIAQHRAPESLRLYSAAKQSRESDDFRGICPPVAAGTAVMLRRMSRPLPHPRPISPAEIQLVRRVVEIGAEPVLTAQLLRDLEGLIVRDAVHGSLDFGSEGRDSVIVAGALGRLDDGREMELVIWAEGGVITHLQVTAHGSTPGRARLPPAASVHAYPPNAHGNEED